MIRYRPSRSSLSASLKEELIFSSLDEVLQHVFNKCVSFSVFVGSPPPSFSDLAVVSLSGNNRLTGYQNERMITLRNVYCIGYCGE